MTTLVALASKDALVMGTDSLATVTRRLVNPFDLYEYFDFDNDFSIKLDDQGKPKLDNFSTIMEQAQDVPYNQSGNVLKLFDLHPLPMGVMFTGITSIGNRTIGKMISAFKEHGEFEDVVNVPPEYTEQYSYTVHSVGDLLRKFLREDYLREYPEEHEQDELELIIGGYSEGSHLPTLCRIDVQQDEIEKIFPDDQPFGVAFGGQMDWIQRIVFGTDTYNKVRLRMRARDLLLKYRQRISEALDSSGIEFEVPRPSSWGDELELFNNTWDIYGLDVDVADFSEQNAIDCVDFFIEIMIRAQDVSSRLPTVGGDINIAVIREDGFRFVSRQEWRHRGHSIKIPGVKQ